MNRRRVVYQVEIVTDNRYARPGASLADLLPAMLRLPAFRDLAGASDRLPEVPASLAAVLKTSTGRESAT